MECLICKFHLITQYSGSMESNMVLEDMPPWKVIREMRNGNEEKNQMTLKLISANLNIQVHLLCL